jgi:hypothetical protein
MHPWHHALSSQALHGGQAADYQAVHDWFDHSKSALAFYTHRALRHHAEGISCAVRTFGEHVVNADGVKVPVQVLGAQHLEEDCRRVPSAADWLACLKAPEWLPQTVMGAEETAAALAKGMGVQASDIVAICAWMLEPSSWFADARHLAMRHHAFGIFEAESVFGITLPTSSGDRLPVRYVAERHVRRVLGRIPTAADWLRRIDGQKWMVQARHPHEVVPRSPD